jgi:hypothetical protein
MHEAVLYRLTVLYLFSSGYGVNFNFNNMDYCEVELHIFLYEGPALHSFAHFCNSRL